MNAGRAAQTGELVRQFRRLRNMTQTELGTPRYSKSYVSAVEKNMIRPSLEALEFFAMQLDLSRDYFTTQFTHPESRMQESPLLESPLMHAQSTQKEMPSSHLLKRIEELLSSPELHELPTPEQANLFYTEGMTALKNQEYDAAQSAFEHALPLASAQLQPFVFDALGQHSYLARSYTTALHYHLRALTMVRQDTSPSIGRSPLFTIALHCGEDYRALGAYKEACNMYTLAHSHLTAEHELKNVALLYFGWGYCIYVLIPQKRVQASTAVKHAPQSEVELDFQRAIKFVTQSRDLSRLSCDYAGETVARLFLTVIELDLSNRPIQSDGTNLPNHAHSRHSFLEDADEQSRDVLAMSQKLQQQHVPPDAATIYEALAYVIRILIKRSAQERSSGLDDNALRKRILATQLCQQALDTLSQPTSLGELLQAGLSLHSAHSLEVKPKLPCLPKQVEHTPDFQSHLLGQAELYYSTGEVAEELGRAAHSIADAHDSYACSDRCFQEGVSLAYAMVASHEREPDYLMRYYQRYTSILEERATAAPEVQEETHSTLLDLLKNELFQMQNAFKAAQMPLQ